MLELSSFYFIFLLSQGYEFQEVKPGQKRKVQNSKRGALNAQAGQSHILHPPLDRSCCICEPSWCIKPCIYLINESSQLCTNFILMGHQLLTSPRVPLRDAHGQWNIFCLGTPEGRLTGWICSVTVCTCAVEKGTCTNRNRPTSSSHNRIIRD